MAIHSEVVLSHKGNKEKSTNSGKKKTLYSYLDSFLLSIGSKELFGQFYLHDKDFGLWNDKVRDILSFFVYSQ